MRSEITYEAPRGASVVPTTMVPGLRRSCGERVLDDRGRHVGGQASTLCGGGSGTEGGNCLTVVAVHDKGARGIRRDSPSPGLDQIGVAMLPGSKDGHVDPPGLKFDPQTVGDGLERELRGAVWSKKRSRKTSADRSDEDDAAA